MLVVPAKNYYEAAVALAPFILITTIELFPARDVSRKGAKNRKAAKNAFIEFPEFIEFPNYCIP